MHGQVNSRGVARVMNPGANENGQTPRRELLATMAEELLQVQDIATALSITIRGVEQALPGYEVAIHTCYWFCSKEHNLGVLMSSVTLFRLFTQHSFPVAMVPYGNLAFPFNME